jgi:hypothetical protein
MFQTLMITFREGLEALDQIRPPREPAALFPIDRDINGSRLAA